MGKIKGAYQDKIAVRMEDRGQQVLQMREAGKTFKVIAQQLGITIQTAISDRNRALAALVAETQVAAERYRNFNVARLEGMYASIEDKIQKGDTRAIDTGLRIIDRINALHGLVQKEQGSGDTNNITFVLDFGSGAARHTEGEQQPAPAEYITGSATRRALAARSATGDDAEHEHEHTIADESA